MQAFRYRPYGGYVGIHPQECSVKIPNGYLVFPSASHPDGQGGVEYVRFVDLAGNETVYYDASEWTRTPEAGKEVMGAILATILNGPDNLLKENH